MLPVRTARDALEDRLVGVSAEVAFFALLAIPPLLLVIAGSAGLVGSALGPDVQDAIQDRLVTVLGGFLSPDARDNVLRPAVTSLFEPGRGGIISLGALLALWSASRLIKVVIEAMNIAYDVEEWRSAWKRRLVALGLTFGGILALAVLLPIVVAGPALGRSIDDAIGLGGVLGTAWRIAYWPVTAALVLAMLTTLYHVAPNWRTPWRRDVPGALLAGAVWVAAAFGLRTYVDVAISQSSFGPLAAPVVLLLWLYVSAFAVLLGAELNAEIEKIWPSPEGGPKEGGRMAALRARATTGIKRVTPRLGRRPRPDRERLGENEASPSEDASTEPGV